MDPQVATYVTLGVVTVVNVGGWIYSKTYSYGAVREMVKRHDKILGNGLVEKVNSVDARLQGLSEKVDTYIKLNEDGRRK